MTEGTSPTEEILRQTNRDLFKRFCVLANKHKYYSDPANRPHYWIDVSLHIERDRLWTEIPQDFSLPAVVVQDVIQEDGREEIELATTSFGRLPRIVISADNILYSTANFYLFNEEGDSLKYEEIERISHDGKTLQENLLGYGISGEVKRLDYKIDEEGRYTQLSVGDYEKLVSILNQIETGELRP
ncbi:MAG: hypothetical protein AAB675_02085 [Patescibacteria group bacterium]